MKIFLPKTFNHGDYTATYTIHNIKDGKKIVARVRHTLTDCGMSFYDALLANGKNVVIDYLLQRFDNLDDAVKCAKEHM